MSTLEIEINEPSAPDMAMLVEQLQLIGQGIVFSTKRIAGDDVFRARMERLSEEVLSFGRDFERYAHQNVAEYDQLVDVAEKQEGELTKFRLQVNMLNDQIRDLTGKLDAAGSVLESGIRAAEQMTSELRAQITGMTASHKNELEQVKRKAERLEGENTRTRKLNAELTQKIHTEVSAHLATKERLNAALLDAKKADNAISILYKEQDAVNGVESKTWIGLKNPKLHFHLHTYFYTLTYRNDPLDIDSPRYVNNLSYHIAIRTTYGVDLVTRLDEWGMIQYQNIELFRGEIPSELITDLVATHHRIVGARNPHLKKFFDWAHSYPLTQVEELTDKDRQQLKDTLEVVNLAQLGACFTTDLTRIKGIGEVTARKWRALAYARGAAWMAEHGQVELEKPMFGAFTAAPVGQQSTSTPNKAVGRSKKHRKGKR